ncbi:hypothetical protein [Pseudomonas aeruginosa]|uniref:hypothetical protein n=1 Tax=Pseudomonas aeruginosa TaxID=287 RepID=UPI003CEB2C1B
MPPSSRGAHFEGRNDASLVQVVGQIRDALFEVFALGAQVEAGFFVKVFQASFHRICAFQVAVLDHLLERFGRHEASVCCDCVMLYGGVVWPVLSLCPAGAGLGHWRTR